MSTVYIRTVSRAAEIAGGIGQLGLRWRVPLELLMSWLEGRIPIPEDIFLRAVDIVIAHEIDEIGNGDRNVNIIPAPAAPDSGTSVPNQLQSAQPRGPRR